MQEYEAHRPRASPLVSAILGCVFLCLIGEKYKYIRRGGMISKVCAFQVILKLSYIETSVQKDFCQKSIFWGQNFHPKVGLAKHR